MKKFYFVTIIGIIMTSCATNYVAQSDVVVTSWDESIVYIKDNEIGKHIYDHWSQGCWGDSTIVMLVDSIEFNKLYEKSYTSRRGSQRR
jgi:hypothetical protein